MEPGGNGALPRVSRNADLSTTALARGAIVSPVVPQFGQTCVCANRFLMLPGLGPWTPSSENKLVEKTRALKVRRRARRRRAQGPLIYRGGGGQVVRGVVDDAKARRAPRSRWAAHGHALGGTFLLEPTVLTGATPDIRISRGYLRGGEEIFGPVAPSFTFEETRGRRPSAMANVTSSGSPPLRLHARPRPGAFGVLNEGLAVRDDFGIQTSGLIPGRGAVRRGQESGSRQGGGRQGLEDTSTRSTGLHRTGSEGVRDRRRGAARVPLVTVGCSSGVFEKQRRARARGDLMGGLCFVGRPSRRNQAAGFWRRNRPTCVARSVRGRP